jgi:bisphosphoglycerate-dependent phosphoglycerate mutase
MDYIGDKLIIAVRHGERTDHAGLTPKLGAFDPELTDKGKMQAYEAGEMVRKYLLEERMLSDLPRIIIATSPFARTLQTTKYFKQGLSGVELNLSSDNDCEISENTSTISKNNSEEPVSISISETQSDKNIKLLVDNRLSEYMNYKFQNKEPKSFLTIYNKQEVLADEFKNETFEFINELDLLPGGFEDNKKCVERAHTSLGDLKEKFLLNNLSDVLILISHASLVDGLNIGLGYPGPHGWKNVHYCSSYIYTHSSETKDICYKKNIVPSLSNQV